MSDDWGSTCVYCGCAPSEHPTVVVNTELPDEKCQGVYERVE